jgi:hypothetical protein
MFYSLRRHVKSPRDSIHAAILPESNIAEENKKIPIPVEFIEKKKDAMLNTRNMTVFRYSGLGVCDLCILYKRNDKSSGLFWSSSTHKNDDGQSIGYFHWVYGLDVRNTMSICTYITDLIQSQEMQESEKRASWLFGKANVEHKCERVIFCCYNFLSRYDLRVDISFPGSVHSYILDETGTKSENITEEMWNETFLCSFLRYEQMINSNEFRSSLPANICIIDPYLLYYNEETEEMLIEQAIRSFSKGFRTGCVNPHRLNEDSAKNGVYICTNVNNEFIVAMRDHFLRSCQYQQALKFFNTLMEQDERVTIHISEILRQMGDQDDAELLISDHLTKNNQDIDLLVTECIAIINKYKKQQMDMVLESDSRANFDFKYPISLARTIIQRAPSKILPWLIIAELYTLSGDITKALSCLNVITLPPDLQEEEHEKTFCFYTGDTLVSYEQADHTDIKCSSAVPPWFILDHYSNNQYVNTAASKEKFVRKELLELPGNRKLIQHFSFDMNNCFHQLSLHSELIMNYTSHSIHSFSPTYRQKLIRSYAYSIILHMNYLIGYDTLLDICNSLFESKQDAIVLEILTTKNSQAEEGKNVCSITSATFSLPENAVSIKKPKATTILDLSAPEFLEKTVNYPYPISVVLAEARNSHEHIKLILSDNDIPAEYRQIISGTPLPRVENHTMDENTATNSFSHTVAIQPWLRDILEILKEDLAEFQNWMQDNTSGTSADWFYRGLLAERFQLTELAINAYKNSMTNTFHLQSCKRLLFFSCSKGDNISEALQLFDFMITFYLNKISILDVSEEFRWHNLHPCIKQSMYTLVARFGLKKVRKLFNKKCKQLQSKTIFMLHELILECVTNKAYGYDM